MPEVSKEKLAKVREHNKELNAGSVTGRLQPKEVREVYENDMVEFSKEVLSTRFGRVEDGRGNKLAAHDISLSRAISYHYGIEPHKQDVYGMKLNRQQQELSVIKQYLRDLGVYTGSDTIYSLSARLGNDNLNSVGVESLLKSHSEFDGLNVSSDIDAAHRFLVPEVIMAAIRLDYENTGMANNWISGTQNITQREIKMPHIKRGATTARVIGEAESIPFGTVAFGQKTATVYKVGTGFKITDELVDSVSLDLMFQFVGEVGNDMSIGSDAEAKNVLINGEQSDASESAPIIGTVNGTSFAWADIKRVTSRMKRLNRDVTRLITDEDDGIDISGIDKFEGFDGSQNLSTLRSIIGVPDTLENDVFPMPADQIMFLAPGSAMIRLRFKGLKVESRRNPQTQEEELFVSDHIGYAIIRRDGRVILDKSIAYSGNGFPSYMDIDSRIDQSFVNIQGV